MAMEQQMEMFAVGGLDDDGMSRDPVSGNEIPPGSMANEVRDDVDAKLSDGEYVVPANVVRFFGVKFFEDLRSQAMQGLSAMEANGRIGGEPVPEAMPMQDQMAGAANELTEQDMAMLQGMMNEGGYVQGYNHGGLHDPVTDKAIPQSVPPSVYPINQFITPGASTISSALNPYVAPSTPPSKITGPGVEGEFKFVTLVNPATGEIQVVQFKGDVPVDANAYNALINSGYFIQGSPELAAYNQQQEQDNNNQERQQSVQDGTKPANRQTVGELLWSAQTGIYNEVFPDSFSAGLSKMGSFGALGQLGKVLPDGPSRLEQSIREAERRLASGKDYQGVAINAAEKAALELLVSFKGEKDMTKVYDAIYNKHGIHTGGKSAKYKRDIRVPNLKDQVMADDLRASRLTQIDPTKYKDDTKRLAEEISTKEVTDLEKSLADIKKYQDKAKANKTSIREEADANNEVEQRAASQREASEDAARGRGTTPVNRGGTGTAGKGVIDKTKDSASAYSGRTGSNREFGMNKGGLLKKPTKKKKTKK